MAGFVMVNGHRHFDDDCEVPGGEHLIGDRHWSIGSRDQEWLANVWVIVCPVDDIPMAGHDMDGWLCCRQCRMRAVDCPVREEAPVPS